MQIKSVARKDLIPFAEKVFCIYKLSAEQIRCCLKGCAFLCRYMESYNVCEYVPQIGEQCINNLYEQSVNKYRCRQVIPAIQALNAYIEGQETFVIQQHSRYQYKDYPFPGEIGLAALEFIKSYSEENRVRKETIRQYRFQLNNFSVLMEMRGVTLSTLSDTDIYAFISSRHNIQSDRFSSLRRFLSYLFTAGKTNRDLSELLFGMVRQKGTKLPSYYEKEEVLAIENAVCRSSCKGKRDYAMILLASRLGLRGSDIVNLNLNNLDWENNVIRLTQQKTGQEVILPLLTEVGNALAEYLRYVRPQSNIKTVFLSLSPPIRPLSIGTFRCILVEYFREAGVKFQEKHHGPPSLRHSLASRMLENGISMPVISEALGHSTTETTLSYLKIDINALLRCSLSVPPVSDDFYNQKGGVLYG